MKRSTFLKTTSLATAPLLLNGINVYANPSTGNSFFDYLAQTTYGCGKVLVIVQMNGGNDGLNTIVPRDQYSKLATARPTIILPEAAVLPLAGTANTGMHPAMSEMKSMYDDGKMVIVQSVSYPNPNFSHFRATDIWFSASDSNVTLDTGWLGRTLDTNYPNFPGDYPNTQMPDPVAIQIGSTLPFSLQGPTVNMGYNVSDPNALLNVLNITTDPAPNNDYGRELSFLRLMKDQSNAYRDSLQNAYNAQTTLSPNYPTGNSLADQLKIVARLIGGGLKTPVYIVNHPNTHDTHNDQVVAGNTTTGYHANVLSVLSKAVFAFQDDLGRMGKADKVTGMTYSEFGRRIINNASKGTDHGVAAPVIFFGAALNAGTIGTSPNIPVNAGVNDQVAMQYDFRQLYSTVMQDWLCLTSTEAQNVLGSNFAKLPIFNQTVLPLQSIVLTGQYYSGRSTLNFQVQNNDQFASFVLESSVDGIAFYPVRTINRQSQNSVDSYSIYDEGNIDKKYYRVKGVMQSGSSIFSDTILLRGDSKKQLMSVYPNPVVGYRINVSLFEKPTSLVDVTIYDVVGAKLYYNRIKPTGGIMSFTTPPSFSHGTHYILEVSYDGTKSREQIMFQ